MDSLNPSGLCVGCTSKIQNTVYIYCDNCLLDLLKCQRCQKPITQEEDEKSGYDEICQSCMKKSEDSDFFNPEFKNDLD